MAEWNIFNSNICTDVLSVWIGLISGNNTAVQRWV
jgi:hypothetical protein